MKKSEKTLVSEGKIINLASAIVNVSQVKPMAVCKFRRFYIAFS